jgi:hypothetical protein
MADEEGDITVKVDADQKEEAADPVAELKAQYDEIQKQQQQDAEARQAAEQRANAADQARRSAEEQAQSARSETQQTRQSAAEQGIENAKTAILAAKSEIKAAMEAGDWAKVADANERLAEAKGDQRFHEQMKNAWEYQQAQQAQAPQRQQQVGDPIENYINQVAQQTPKSADWLRAHRDWITDPRKNAKLTAAHWDAVGEGLTVDTPQYFDHVERTIGMKETPSKANGGSVSARRQAAPVAPVTPSPGGTSGGGTEVRLTKGEAQAATDGTLIWNYDDPSGQKRFKKGDPIGLQEMARRKKELAAQGQYDKVNYEA